MNTAHAALPIALADNPEEAEVVAVESSASASP